MYSIYLMIKFFCYERVKRYFTGVDTHGRVRVASSVRI
jgi:hypothetical protein